VLADIELRVHGRTLHLHRRKVPGRKIDKNDLGQYRVQWTFLELNGQVTQHLPFQLIVRSKVLALVNPAMQSDEPGNESASCVVTVGRLVVVDQLTLLPRRNDALELGLEVCLGLWVRVFAGQRAVQVVDGAEVVAVFARDDGELVLGMA
jgi:hypothetical protein